MSSRLPGKDRTRQGKMLRLRRHLGLGAGGAVENSFQNAPLAMANPIYNVGYGVNPVLIGIAMAIPRFWEILIDPLIGTLSDKTTSRWGRRVPYMACGLLGSFLLFAAMWFVPTGWSKNSMGIWLIVTTFLFYTAYSFFAVPYAALTIDASEAGSDRIGLMTVRTVFANLSTIGISWLYWFCQRDWFSSPVEAMRWVGLGFGLMTVLCGTAAIMTALNSLHESGSSCHDAQLPSKGSLRNILSLGSTRCMMIALLSTLMGFTLVGHLGFYLLGFYACRGDLKEASLIGALSATLTLGIAIISCPLIGAAAKRFGKDIMFDFLVLLGGISSMSMWFLITPINPYLSIISQVGISICLVGFWTLMPAYLGDISDSYKAMTGNECQGTLSAIYGVAVKCGASGALLLTGYILVICGFHADLSQNAMSSPLWKMRVLFAVIPAIGLAIAFVAMKRFRHYQRRESLRAKDLMRNISVGAA